MAMKRIYFAQSIDEAQQGFQLITAAAAAISPDIDIITDIDIAFGDSELSLIEQTYNAIETVELIVADISTSNPNTLYELGYAHGLRRPVILMSQKTSNVPFDLRSVPTLFYDLEPEHTKELVIQLKQLIEDALKSPAAFSRRPSVETSINSVFISYSHRDIEFLNRLMVHLRPLEKEGIVDLWADTKLKVGDKWKIEIEVALKKARVAILLVSADFLASDFIVNNELPPILSKAESQGTRVIPVVLKPCRFLRDKHLSTFQSVNDPNIPLATLSESEQEKVYDEISDAVERLVIR